MLKGSLMERDGTVAVRTRDTKWNIFNRTHRKHVASLSGQGKQIFNAPLANSDPGFHRRGHAQRLVNPAEVVIRVPFWPYGLIMGGQG